MFKVGDKVKYIGRFWSDYLTTAAVYTIINVVGTKITLEGLAFNDLDATLFELVKQPHIHAKVIKAWAEGAKIQEYSIHSNTWVDVGKDSRPILWSANSKYRVKPDPKPDETIKVVQFVRNAGTDINYAVEITYNGDTGTPKDMRIVAREYQQHEITIEGKHTVTSISF